MGFGVGWTSVGDEELVKWREGMRSSQIISNNNIWTFEHLGNAIRSSNGICSATDELDLIFGFGDAIA